MLTKAPGVAKSVCGGSRWNKLASRQSTTNRWAPSLPFRDGEHPDLAPSSLPKPKDPGPEEEINQLLHAPRLPESGVGVGPRAIFLGNETRLGVILEYPTVGVATNFGDLWACNVVN